MKNKKENDMEQDNNRKEIMNENKKRCTCGDDAMRPSAYDPACPIDGIDIEDEWQEEINNLPANWGITDIIKEGK